MHGGAIYPDNGSAGWDVHDNVMEKVVHWGFDKMSETARR